MEVVRVLNCTKCGGDMTRENAKVHPEYFLHDACLPEEMKPVPVDPKACEHLDFAAEVIVNRITDGEVGKVMWYMADVRMKCVRCGTPFRFIGLPAGMDYNSPCVSVDACEARMPIAPKGEVLSELEGGVVGFSIRKVDKT